MTSEHTHTTSPSEEPYDPAQDPDTDPESISSGHILQPDKPEGVDLPDETGA